MNAIRLSDHPDTRDGWETALILAGRRKRTTGKKYVVSRRLKHNQPRWCVYTIGTISHLRPGTRRHKITTSS